MSLLACLAVPACCLACREMAMLQEVDQPGSSIDQYVDSLEAVLTQKMDAIRKLQAHLERFKSKLRQEDLLSRTVHKKQTLPRT
jgi:kinesin family protein 2/24